MTLDRRHFLAGITAAGAAGIPLAAPGSSAGGVRVRRPISTLSPDDPDVAALRRAIPLMRKSGAWEAQIALHSDMRNRQHTSWRFLPWHRLQVLRFEQIVARYSGKRDFALPYWDWANDPFPALFYEDPVFRMPGRVAPRGMVMNSRWYTARLDDSFDTFFGAPRENAGPRHVAGSAEWGGHNLMHGFVGGDMNDLMRAPNDPIFWLHHANVDRAWTLWRRHNPDAVYPQAWQEEVLSGLIDADGQPAPSMTAGATTETFAFGYTYPHDPSVPPVVGRQGVRTARPARQTLEARRIWAGAGVLEIPAALANRRDVRAVGFIEIECNPRKSAMVLVTARRLAENREVFRDTIFAIPMGMCFEAAAYRIALDGLWNTPGYGPLELRVDVGSILGLQHGRAGAVLRSVVLEVEEPGRA